MSWVAVGVTVVGAVGGAASANSANKKAKAANSQYNQLVEYGRANPDAFGEKLDWKNVNYSPLYPNGAAIADVAGQSINGNRANFGAASSLAGMTNDWMKMQQQARLNEFDPTFMDSYGQQARNTASLLRGEIPMEDMNAIISNRTERQGLSGANIGQQQVAADLGLTRLNLMNQGQQALAGNAALYGNLFPQQNYMNVQSMFVDPSAAINTVLNENQFAYNARVNERNQRLAYAAMPDPYESGVMDLIAARAGVQAANPGANVGGGALLGGLQSYGGYVANSGQLYGGQNANNTAYNPNWTQPSSGYNGTIRKTSDRTGLYV